MIDLAQAIAPLLSREEFHAAYAIQWVAHSYGVYGVEHMAPSTIEETFEHLGSALQFGILRLHSAGHEFPAIRVDENSGELYPIAEAEVTPGNIMYIHQIAVGRSIHFLMLVQSAIAFIEQRELDLDLDPLRTAENEIQRLLAQTKEDMDPETANEIREVKANVLRVGEQLSRGGLLNVGRIRDN